MTDTNKTVLTDDEIQDIADGFFDIYGPKPEFARAIERAVLAKLDGMTANEWLTEAKDAITMWHYTSIAQHEGHTDEADVQAHWHAVEAILRARILPTASEAGAVPMGYATEWKPGFTAVYFDAVVMPPGTPVYAAPPAPIQQAGADACEHRFHYFGDEKERRCDRCCVLESKAAPAAQGGGDADFEIRQDGMPVAATSGPRERSLADAQHYAMMYSADGPVDLVEIVKVAHIDAARAQRAEGGSHE